MSHRLWSLLDMIAVQGTDLVGALSDLTLVTLRVVQNPKSLADQKMVNTAIIALNKLIGALVELELDSSFAQAKKIEQSLELPSWKERNNLYMLQFLELQSRIKDELRARKVLVLGSSAAILYEQKTPPFGEQVSGKFPKAQEDISEAGKCFALGLYTASVFHLMRALEIMLQKAGKSVKADVIDRNGQMKDWGRLLSAMKPKIDDLQKAKKRTQWQEIHALLYAVKEAWRNDTMHPKQTYTKDEARVVFDSVRAFALRLASVVR